MMVLTTARICRTPDVLAAEIVEDLQNALEQFTGIAATLSGSEDKRPARARACVKAATGRALLKLPFS